MQKAQRDNVLSQLSGDQRQQLRGVIAVMQEARAGGLTSRQVLESWPEELPADVRAGLQAIVARDEKGPKVGERPRDFALKRLGSRERVGLSDFQGRRPVALAFGSYT